MALKYNKHNFYINLGQLGTGKGGGPFTYCLAGRNIESTVLTRQDKIDSIKNNIPDTFTLKELRDLCAKLNIKESFYGWFIHPESKQCIRKYHGKNQFDPSKYKIIK